ncbi:MAG: hypothetical protein WD023_08700, partial [Ilumatobacteraceae bacterium]
MAGPRSATARGANLRRPRHLCDDLALDFRKAALDVGHPRDDGSRYGFGSGGGAMRRSAWALVMATAGLVACSGGSGEVAPVSFDPVATTVPQVVTTPAPSTTEVTTTVPMTTAPSLPVSDLTGPVFSDELGVKVATAPGVNTPGDTRQLLPEGLYVHIAWTADPNDPSVFTVQPDDIPILEA